MSNDVLIESGRAGEGQGGLLVRFAGIVLVSILSVATFVNTAPGQATARADRGNSTTDADPPESSTPNRDGFPFDVSPGIRSLGVEPPFDRRQITIPRLVPELDAEGRHRYRTVYETQSIPIAPPPEPPLQVLQEASPRHENIQRLSRRVLQAKDLAERATLEKELESEVEALFDEQRERQGEAIDRLEAQVQLLRQLDRKRQERKDEIVRRRVRELLGEWDLKASDRSVSPASESGQDSTVRSEADREDEAIGARTMMRPRSFLEAIDVSEALETAEEILDLREQVLQAEAQWKEQAALKTPAAERLESAYEKARAKLAIAELRWAQKKADFLSAGKELQRQSEAAKTKMDRIKRLVEQGLAPVTELSDAESTWSLARFNEEAASRTIRAVEQVESILQRGAPESTPSTSDSK